MVTFNNFQAASHNVREQTSPVRAHVSSFFLNSNGRFSFSVRRSSLMTNTCLPFWQRIQDSMNTRVNVGEMPNTSSQ